MVDLIPNPVLNAGAIRESPLRFPTGRYVRWVNPKTLVDSRIRGNDI
ncbi:hypothetical protein [Planktothricoides sp. SR001]|nr:hypothetical protein [Planktothricoides sp. SR001]